MALYGKWFLFGSMRIFECSIAILLFFLAGVHQLYLVLSNDHSIGSHTLTTKKIHMGENKLLVQNTAGVASMEWYWCSFTCNEQQSSQQLRSTNIQLLLQEEWRCSVVHKSSTISQDSSRNVKAIPAGEVITEKHPAESLLEKIDWHLKQLSRDKVSWRR